MASWYLAADAPVRRIPAATAALAWHAGRASRVLPALAVLAGLSGALPWALWHFTGWPLPRTVPSLTTLEDGLAQPIGPDTLIKALACVVWVLWLLFMTSLASETAAQAARLRGPSRGLSPAPATARRPLRALAAVLIGAVILTLISARAAHPRARQNAAPGSLPASPAATAPAIPGPPRAAGHGGAAAPPGSHMAAAAAPAAANRGAPPAAAHTVALAAPGLAGGPGQAGSLAAGSGPAVPVLAAEVAHERPATTAQAWRYYTVRPPGPDGIHDCLWLIAEHELGDAARWPQIYQLNAGRLQPGGQRLTSPSLIQPGWILRLPPAPRGHPPAARPPRRPQHAAPRPAPPARSARPPAHPSAPAPRPSPQHQPAHRAGGPGISLPSGGLAGITLAAAVAAALVLARVHQRRRYRPAQPLTSALQPAGPPLPPVITALRRSARPPGPDSPDLDLYDIDVPALSPGPDPQGHAPGGTDPDPGPEDTRPEHALPGPHPQAAAPGPGGGGPGIPAAVLASPGGGPPPGPAATLPSATISLGVRGGDEIHADIAALGGLGLTGPGAPAAARAILASLLSQGLPGQAGMPAEVIIPAADAAALLPGYGPRDEGGAAQPAGLSVPASLDAALGQLEAVILHRARMTGALDAAGDPPASSPAVPLPAAALIATPHRAASQRLRNVLELGRSLGVAGILLGDWPSGVTCQAAADGVITAALPGGVLDGVRLFHLAAGDTAAVISALRAARGVPPGDGPGTGLAGVAVAPDPARRADDQPAAPAPPPAFRREPAPAAPDPPAFPAVRHLPASPAAGSDARPGARAPAAALPARPGSAAGSPAAPPAAGAEPVQVSVLGPLRITAAGREIRGGLRKARELLAFLTVHPGGVTGEAISEALWPGSAPGYAAGQRALALRKLRDLLRTATGLAAPMFVILADERYRLDGALAGVDLWRFQEALDDARLADDDTARLAACQHAAALYRGPFTDGAGYDWAEPYAEAARRRVLDAWTRIAELLEPRDPEQALAAVETALGHDPYNEYLYQRIMRLQAAAGRPDAVRRTLMLLENRLGELGITPGAETRQAAAALLGAAAPAPAAAVRAPQSRPSPGPRERHHVR